MSNIIFPFLSEFFSDKENASQCFTTLEHTYLWKTRNVSSVIVIDSFCLLDFIRLYVRHHQKEENEKEEWIVLSGSLLSWEDVGQLFFDLLKEKLLLEYKLLKVHFVWNSVEWEAHWPDLQLCSEPNQNHHHHYPTSLEYNVFSLWAQEAMAAVRAEFPDRVQVSLTPRHVEQLLPSGIRQEDENKPPCNVQNINSTATLMTAQEEMTTLNHFFNVRRTTKKPFNVFKNAQNEYHFPYVGNMKSLSEVTYTYQYVYPCVLVWISTTSFMQYNNENNNNPNPNPVHSLEYFFYSPIQNRMNTDTPPNGEFADYIPHPPQICVNGAQFLLNSFLAKYTIQNKPFEPSADPLWWYKFGEVNQRISTEEAEKDNTNHNNENALENTFFRLFLHPQLKTFCPKVLAKKIGLRTSNNNNKNENEDTRTVKLRYLPLLYGLLRVAELSQDNNNNKDYKEVWRRAVEVVNRYGGYLTNALVADWWAYLHENENNNISIKELDFTTIISYYYHSAGGGSSVFSYSNPQPQQSNLSQNCLLWSDAKPLFGRYLQTPLLLENKIKTCLFIQDHHRQNQNALYHYLYRTLWSRMNVLTVESAEHVRSYPLLKVTDNHTQNGNEDRTKKVHLYTLVDILNHYFQTKSNKTPMGNALFDFIHDGVGPTYQLPLLTLIVLFHESKREEDENLKKRPITGKEIQKFFFFICFCYSLRDHAGVLLRLGMDYKRKQSVLPPMTTFLSVLREGAGNEKEITFRKTIRQTVREMLLDASWISDNNNENEKDSFLHPWLLARFSPLLHLLTLLALYFTSPGVVTSEDNNNRNGGVVVKGVQRHVLALEGGYISAALLKKEAECFGFLTPHSKVHQAAMEEFLFSILRSNEDWTKGSEWIGSELPE